MGDSLDVLVHFRGLPILHHRAGDGKEICNWSLQLSAVSSKALVNRAPCQPACLSVSLCCGSCSFADLLARKFRRLCSAMLRKDIILPDTITPDVPVALGLERESNEPPDIPQVIP